jgi:hypothetical protein
MGVYKSTDDEPTASTRKYVLVAIFQIQCQTFLPIIQRVLTIRIIGCRVCSSSGILCIGKHNVSEGGFVSVLR